MNFKGLQKVSTISERLQIAMDKRKIKQIDLARVADVNQGALSRYLKGSYEPKSATIYKLALALDVSDMWLEGYDVQNARYHSTTADRFAGAASQTDSFRLLNGTFHQRSVGRRLLMRQGGRTHDDQRSSWNYWR